MANINKIRVSGTTYDIQDINAPKVIELTQSEYDSLTTKDPNAFYVITDSEYNFDGYWTSAQTQSAITQSVSGKADTSAVTSVSDSLTAHTANTTVHVTAQDKTNWNAKSDFSGNYNDLTNKPTIPSKTSDLTNDSNFATTSDVQTATADMATKTWVGNQGYLTEHQSLSNYYKKSETSGATEISTALASKQSTLESGTNIKTINNESILGSGNIDIQGGGGKAIEAGRGISITTGETADTVSFNFPISANTDNSIVMGGKIVNSFTNNGRDCLMVGSELTANDWSDCCLVVGYRSSVNGDGSAVIGWNSKSVGDSAFAFGTNVTANTAYTFAAGRYSIAKNNDETSFGKYNASNTGSTNADKTLFSVGNGTNDNARHNAFEIRQNGDIYLTLDGQDVKLQDQLGGGGSSYTAGDGIDITNDVISVTGKVDTSTYNTYTAATDTALASKADTATTYTKTEVDTALASKQTTLTAGTGISIVDNVISAEGGGGVNVVQTTGTSTADVMSQDAVTTQLNNKANKSAAVGGYQFGSDYAGENLKFLSVSTSNVGSPIYYPKINGKYILTTNATFSKNNYNFQLVETSAITTAITSSSTDAQVPSAKAVNDKLGGLNLVKLTQAQYDALATKDSNTLYVIVN